MSGSQAVEIDFFRLKDESSSHKKLSDRRDFQGVISKINPVLMKTAIASAYAKKQKTNFVKSNSYPQLHHLQTLPVFNNNNNVVKDCGSVGMAPLTIFYNGSVSVFDVSPDQAEKILKLAENSSSSSKNGGVISNENNNNNKELLGGVMGRSDLPMLRKKSLKRFLEKRKQRQVTINPYAFSQGSEC